MDILDFEQLGEAEKRVLIFEADKIAERCESIYRFELFRIDNFFVEVVTSLARNARRHIHTFSFGNLPDVYRNSIRFDTYDMGSSEKRETA